MALRDVTIYYMEMRAPASRIVPAPRDGLAILHARRPSVAYYRFLYHTVGDAYHWHSRGKLSDVVLAGILADPLDEIHVLHVDGTPAGFAELDRRDACDVELVQFGLMPEFVGQGLGKYFLQHIVEYVWSHAPKRFWLHTCTLDHPHAVPNYEKAGFRIYHQEIIQRDV
jgi:GNAT superfamily N-acetyltransferase